MQRQHFPRHLSPGEPQQKAVAGEGGQLGIGGHVGIAVDEIVAQKAVGPIALADLLNAETVYGIAHGISHGQTQQRPPHPRQNISHTAVPPFPFGDII